MSNKLSVIICTFNRAESLKQCLESLTRQSFKDFEVVVVDASSDQTEKVIGDYSAKLNIKRITDDKKGLAKARDKGWRASSGNLVAWLDDDTAAWPNWAESIVEIMDKETNVGGVSGPTLVKPELLKNRDVFFFYGQKGLMGFLGKFWNSFFLEGKMFEPGCLVKSGAWTPGSNFPECLSIEGLKEVDYLEACNITLRRQLVEKAGGFDPGFTGTAEWCEIDLAQKIKKMGYRLVFSPKIGVDHNPSRAGGFCQRTRARERMENFFRFYFRHIFKFRPDHLFKFFAYVVFLNLYWTYKAFKTRNLSWLGGWVGSATGLKNFIFRHDP